MGVKAAAVPRPIRRSSTGRFRAYLRTLPTSVFLLLCSAAACGDSASPPEYAVKAAFIHNIVTKFVTWPAGALAGKNVLRLCVLGKDPFGGALETLRGMEADGRYWEVSVLPPTVRPTDCQVLFVAASEAKYVLQIVDSLGADAVFTFGDTEGFAQHGIMVNFYLEGQKVRFEINRDAVRRAGFAISSQLLKLARIVGEGSSGD